MAMEKTLAVALFLAALVVVTVSVSTATAEKTETKDIGSKSPATKVGLWGGAKGAEKDIPEEPTGLRSVTIVSNYSINSIGFSYTDKTAKRREAGPWGGPGGTAHTIDLFNLEEVIEISGTYNVFDGENCLTSFRLVTTARTWGPWAEENGKHFCFTAPSGSKIVGFFAREGKYLDAIGVYLNKLEWNLDNLN